ncbi:Cytochrome P450 2J2 [Hypsibius exemplaris]|uniref:Cytochrome P450 2J2 n=1 Tax=Hypsibius exemplaris TaxID=2072580 RepID=A0A1W0X444_HYPEX|nr:Cytochrome P450 2J2 [Hypsibius exemplaris]
MACPVAHIIIEELLPYIMVAVLTPILLTGYCCYRCCRKRRVKKPVMPSPFQLPILGCLPFLSREEGTHVTFSRWATKYGGLFACRLAQTKCVVISDAKLVREALASNAVVGRPNLHLFNLARKPEEPESKGIIMNEGESWRQQRRFALHTFRNFGIGKTSFEDVIAVECDRLAECITINSRTGPFDARMLLNSAVANVISTVLFGPDVQHSDADLARFVDHVTNMAQELGGSALMNFFPFLRHLPPFRAIYARIYSGMLFNFGVLRALVEQEKRQFNEENIRSYTAAFLARQRSEEDGRLFTDHHLVMSLSDIFSAGFETTATSLRWALLYICLDEKLQQTLQEEVDHVAQDGRPIRLADREKLPWVEATLLEVQRIASIAPLSMPHAVTEDVELGGYVLEKGTVVFPNLYHVHHDPKNFPEPEKFKPARFLDESQTKVAGTENLMPFSAGKRICPGESLARMELFLFFTMLLQRFNFELPKGSSVDVRPRCGLTNDTRPYELTAILRGKNCAGR